MRAFQDRVAVVTGAASGIGFGLAERFVAEGMKVVLADVERAALTAADEKLRGAGATTLPVVTDVSDWKAMEALATQAFDTFGEVHVLCNNAGVSAGARSLWEHSLEDWRWVFGVNLWGVIHGIRAFVPRMLAHGGEGHIVNTASVAGLMSGWGIYGVSKHAVVSLSETLYQQFVRAKARIGVSVLCPGFVKTNIMDSQRNRPAELQSGEPPPMSEEQEQQAKLVRQGIASGLAPSDVAAAVLDGIQEQRLYIVPAQPQLKKMIRQRAENVTNERNP